MMVLALPTVTKLFIILGPSYLIRQRASWLSFAYVLGGELYNIFRNLERSHRLVPRAWLQEELSAALKFAAKHKIFGLDVHGGRQPSPPARTSGSEKVIACMNVQRLTSKVNDGGSDRQQSVLDGAPHFEFRNLIFRTAVVSHHRLHQGSS